MNQGPQQEPHYPDDGGLFDDRPFAAAGSGRETSGDRDRRRLLAEAGRLAAEGRATRRRQWVRRGRPTHTPPPWSEVQARMAALHDDETGGEREEED
ncbi:MAG TPA: hypothetical protein VGS28_03990 [Candidatus Saccharimonadales bacterium]|nr:hypothetical protein [Candidatus Saccharimonadales bacterium]